MVVRSNRTCWGLFRHKWQGIACKQPVVLSIGHRRSAGAGSRGRSRRQVRSARRSESPSECRSRTPVPAGSVEFAQVMSRGDPQPRCPFAGKRSASLRGDASTRSRGTPVEPGHADHHGAFPSITVRPGRSPGSRGNPSIYFTDHQAEPIFGAEAVANARISSVHAA